MSGAGHVLEVGLGDRSYPIHIGEALLTRADLLLPALAGRDVLIVTDENVAPLYLEALTGSLSESGGRASPAGKGAGAVPMTPRVRGLARVPGIRCATTSS